MGWPRVYVTRTPTSQTPILQMSALSYLQRQHTMQQTIGGQLAADPALLDSTKIKYCLENFTWSSVS